MNAIHEKGMELLERLKAQGHIWVDGCVYVGKATDGVEVSLGNVGFEDDMFPYLIDHPTPEDWTAKRVSK